VIKTKKLCACGCGCGCGRVVEKGNTYINGHNRRGTKYTIEKKRHDLPTNDICDQYINGETPMEISKEYGCAKGTIVSILNDNNIRIRNSSEAHKINLSEEEICKDYIMGNPAPHIAERYKCSIMVIMRILNNNNIKIRPNGSGSDSNAWKGGLSFGKYCPLFNNKFKTQIRNDYNNRCFLCGKSKEENVRELDVHHVNYDKNCICGNLCEFVPLCHPCHSTTNGNRRYWEDLIMCYLYPERFFMINI